MVDVVKYRRDAPAPRDRHDAGRVSGAWRWFSARTARRAARYRDVGWGSIARHAVVAAGLVTLSRLFPNEAFAPFALLAGAIWLAVTARIAIIKMVHGRRRDSRPNT